MGVIVKNERGGSLFYTLTKNQIVWIISIASYLTKKKFETKKLFVVADKSALWDAYFFLVHKSSSSFGTSWIKNKAELCTTDHCFFERDRGGRIEMQPCNSW